MNRRLDFILVVMILTSIMLMPAIEPMHCDCETKTTYKTETVGAAWKTVKARVTEYCPCCNCPAGHGSSSGTYLTDGCAACAWLPVGTKIKVFGQIYTIVDTCGTDAIDLFRDTSTCQCDLNTWAKVQIREK